ncbi:MAG: aldo/keto reductase [Halobacterium sp.]
MPEPLPAVGVGTYGLDPGACQESVRTALDAGYRHVDTAEMYENEAAVGDALAAGDVDRKDVFVATKVHSRNLAYDDAVDAARASRDRLGVDAIDLLYVHWPIRAYDPAETLAAFDALHADGVVRHVGVSNFTPELLADAVDRLDAPLFAHQVECHPLLQQDDLRALASEHDHHLVAYSPLAKGAVLDHPTIRDVAAAHDATPAQVSLAWLLSKDRVAAVPRSTSPEHLRENLAARDLELDADALARLDDIDETARQVDFADAPWN